MLYQGGKARIAARLSRLMLPPPCGVFVSLFCGSCAVESKVQGFSRIICNDKHRYLIAMLQGVQGGYELPDTVSETEYRYIREHKDDDPVLTGFVGFGCSFGGKWFGGYARDRHSDRSYASGSKKTLLQTMATLGDAEFICGDYRAVPIPQGAVVYADPPYRNTTGYGGEKFDTDEFWTYMRLLAQTGHTVFVSELEAPDDFVCIWEKPVQRSLDRNVSNRFFSTEKLFTYALSTE